MYETSIPPKASRFIIDNVNLYNQLIFQKNEGSEAGRSVETNRQIV